MTDVVRLITQDHRQFEKLFDQIKVDRERRAELLDLVAASLAAHSRAEEEEVYPAVAEEAGEREEAGHGTEEHHEAEELLAEVRRLPTDGPEFDAKFKEFVDAINHHVEEEETEILPALGKAVSTKRLEELGVAFAQRRDEVLAFGEDGE
ncbi:hemerythrin domain-containing protein, partial [Actinomadura sp. HBU206391]|uniref:hemerythrin domain-containing protein n=1 Tax=Actinomadura sp. HBU206391 TaxID=2731692 RepID=UPI00164EEB43